MDAKTWENILLRYDTTSILESMAGRLSYKVNAEKDMINLIELVICRESYHTKHSSTFCTQNCDENCKFPDRCPRYDDIDYDYNIDEKCSSDNEDLLDHSLCLCRCHRHGPSLCDCEMEYFYKFINNVFIRHDYLTVKILLEHFPKILRNFFVSEKDALKFLCQDVFYSKHIDYQLPNCYWFDCVAPVIDAFPELFIQKPDDKKHFLVGEHSQHEQCIDTNVALWYIVTDMYCHIPLYEPFIKKYCHLFLSTINLPGLDNEPLLIYCLKHSELLEFAKLLLIYMPKAQ